MGPLRLVAQDIGFSVREQGFDSPRGSFSQSPTGFSRSNVIKSARGTTSRHRLSRRRYRPYLVLPQHVGFAVAVEVGGTRQRPDRRIGLAEPQHRPAGYPRADHAIICVARLHVLP